MYKPKSGIGGPYESYVFNGLRNYQTFPKWLYYFTLPPEIYGNSNFPTSSLILIIWCSDCSHPCRCEVIACRFGLHFPGDKRQVSFHVYWPFVYLWRNVFSNPLPAFSLGCLSYWVIRVLYSRYCKSLIRYMILKYFFLLFGWSFYFLDVNFLDYIPLMQKAFPFCEAQFFLLWFELFVSYLRNCWQIWGHEDLFQCSLPILLWF